MNWKQSEAGLLLAFSHLFIKVLSSPTKTSDSRLIKSSY